MADLTKSDNSSHNEGKVVHKKRLPSEVKVLICEVVMSNFSIIASSLAAPEPTNLNLF